MLCCTGPGSLNLIVFGVKQLLMFHSSKRHLLNNRKGTICSSMLTQLFCLSLCRFAQIISPSERFGCTLGCLWSKAMITLSFTTASWMIQIMHYLQFPLSPETKPLSLSSRAISAPHRQKEPISSLWKQSLLSKDSLKWTSAWLTPEIQCDSRLSVGSLCWS